MNNNNFRISDADIFCIMTNLKNPNNIDFDNLHKEEVNTVNFLIALANNLSYEVFAFNDQQNEQIIQGQMTKPVFIADGLVTMFILFYCSHNISGDVFFCPTVLDSLAGKVLADHLKVYYTFYLFLLKTAQ